MSSVFRNALMPSENQQVLRLRLAYLMRRFLLLALGMGFLLPTAAKAESVWLIFYIRSNYGVTSEKIQMISMDQCEEQGQIFLKEKMGGGVLERGNKYICLKGK